MELKPKAKPINDLLEAFTGKKRDGKQCAFCPSTKTNEEDFRDDLSRAEFAISSLCQECQDQIFGAKQ